MTDKVDIRVSVPLSELTKVFKAINAFGELLNDIDECVLDTELAYIASNANEAHGDGIDLLNTLPLVTQFNEQYFGID